MRSILVLACALTACSSKKQPPPAVTRDAGALGKAADAGTHMGSPLPERGPHPDYPTPLAAGTDKLFLLEDPDRGAKIAATYELADRESLAWTSFAHCEVDVLDVICSPGGSKWRVARKKDLVVAEELRGSTYVFEASRRIELDAYGRVVEQLTLLGDDRYSARRPNGENGLHGCGSMKFALDKARHTTELRCLQWTGDAMRDTTGVASRRIVRDAHGFTIETHNLGLDDMPIADTTGVTITHEELDAAGRTVATHHRDGKDQPVDASSGCFGVKLEYDARGQLARTTCLGRDDKPITGTNGIASETAKYDAAGCRIQTRWFDPANKPARDRANVHGYDFTRDEHCAETGQTCVNVVGQPLACGMGREARTVTTRDELGRATSTKYYKPDGTAAKSAVYGAFELRFQNDDVGNQIGLSCYDAANKAVLCGSTGFHGLTRVYDDAGRLVEERYLDPSGAASTNMGTAIRRIKYDNYDHRYETTSLDAQGQPTSSYGLTTRRELYDAAHRTFGIVLLDRSGQPARYEACYTGSTCPSTPWHAVRMVRGRDGTVEKNMFFDQLGQLIVTMDCAKTPCFD